jgi:hypothetical protein
MVDDQTAPPIYPRYLSPDHPEVENQPQTQKFIEIVTTYLCPAEIKEIAEIYASLSVRSLCRRHFPLFLLFLRD